MQLSRLILTIVVIFVLSAVLGNVVHAVLLHDAYAALPLVFKSAKEADFALILLSELAFAVGSVWIYTHGVEDQPWFAQGVRFGAAMWMVTSLPMYVLAYATQPIPEALMWKQLGYEFVSKVILGIVTAALVRKK
jgi:hypothetical protein